MRLIFGIALLLLGVGTLSCRLDGLPVKLPSNPQEVDWVRTANGWERTSAWTARETSSVKLNPLVVAAGQAMLSILVLSYYAEDAGNCQKRDSTSA